MLKADFHTHAAGDPVDAISYSPFDLVDRAAALGYAALAITLHDRQLPVHHVAEYGRRRGVAVLPGIERTIGGKHVLLVNFSAAAEEVATFEDIARLKADSAGLVIAPHPFYPMRSCLGAYLDRYADLFDAVEVNAFYLQQCDFNQRAIKWARAHGKPLVGNGDIHRLSQLGTTYSLVDAPANPDAICRAVREGRVEIRTSPLSVSAAAALFASLALGDLAGLVLPEALPRASRTVSAAG